MELTKLLDREHIFLDTRVQSDTDAIHRLGEVLKQSGYINDKYIDAVLAREVEFPTGLQLSQQGIAIPHATPEGNVAENGIAVCRLEEPVVFHSMEDADDTVPVSMIFMLALKDANEHLAMLQKLFTMFQQEEQVEKLLTASTADDFQQAFLSALQ